MFGCSCIRVFVRSCVRVFVCLVVRVFAYSYVCSCVREFLRLCVRMFGRSCVLVLPRHRFTHAQKSVIPVDLMVSVLRTASACTNSVRVKKSFLSFSVRVRAVNTMTHKQARKVRKKQQDQYVK